MKVSLLSLLGAFVLLQNEAHSAVIPKGFTPADTLLLNVNKAKQPLEDKIKQGTQYVHVKWDSDEQVFGVIEKALEVEKKAGAGASAPIKVLIEGGAEMTDTNKCKAAVEKLNTGLQKLETNAKAKHEGKVKHFFQHFNWRPMAKAFDSNAGAIQVHLEGVFSPDCIAHYMYNKDKAAWGKLMFVHVAPKLVPGNDDLMRSTVKGDRHPLVGIVTRPWPTATGAGDEFDEYISELPSGAVLRLVDIPLDPNAPEGTQPGVADFAVKLVEEKVAMHPNRMVWSVEASELEEDGKKEDDTPPAPKPDEKPADGGDKPKPDENPSPSPNPPAPKPEDDKKDDADPPKPGPGPVDPDTKPDEKKKDEEGGDGPAPPAPPAPPKPEEGETEEERRKREEEEKNNGGAGGWGGMGVVALVAVLLAGGVWMLKGRRQQERGGMNAGLVANEAPGARV